MELSFFSIAGYKKDFPGTDYLEIRPDWREQLPGQIGASGRWMQTILLNTRSVLDVGAGDRYYQQVLAKLGIAATYKSADSDNRSAAHDFEDFFNVSETFDAVLMLELLEHVDADLGLRFLRHALEVLNPEGVLLISTPNAHHPNQVWRSSVTHIRPWPADDLYGVLKYVGFKKVELIRQYTASSKRRMVRPITKLLYRLMESDHAQTILAAAWRD
jgi:predicted SAM-dependent methyltransferase